MSDALTLAAVAESNTGTNVRRPLPIRKPNSGNVSSVGTGRYRLPANIRTNTPTYPSEWTTSMTHRTRSMSTPPIVLYPPISSEDLIMHHATHHGTPDTYPSVRSTRVRNPHARFPESIDSHDTDVRFPPVILRVGCDNKDVLKDFKHRYRAVRGRDVRFDGWFYVAVTSTGVYCRPSCPAATPQRSNVRFFPTAAAAQYAGFRACKRCRPDAVPGSPEWDVRADVVARAMRLIADGVVDRDGVAGLARRLGYTERHLHRLLSAEVGAGPLAIARAQRAQTARVLIETTDLGMAEIAFAAGFSSIRQFNDTVRSVFATAPTDLRARAGGRRASPVAPGTLSLRLSFRAPLCPDNLFGHLAATAVPGVEEVRDGAYRRTLRLAHGPGVVALRPAPDHVACRLTLTDVRDLTSAISRCRRLLDLDADPVAVDELLAADPVLAPLVTKA